MFPLESLGIPSIFSVLESCGTQIHFFSHCVGHWVDLSPLKIYDLQSWGNFFKRFYLFIFRERGKKGERERNINVWLPLECLPPGTLPPTQACTLTGNPTGDLLVYRPALNPLSHTSQGQFWEIFKCQCDHCSLSIFLLLSLPRTPNNSDVESPALIHYLSCGPFCFVFKDFLFIYF